MTSARGSASFRFLSPGRRLKAYCGTLAYEKTSVLIAGSEVAILFIGAEGARYPLLRLAVSRWLSDGWPPRRRRADRDRHEGADCRRPRLASGVLSQGRQSHFRQRARFLAEFHTTHPGCEVTLIEGVPGHLAELLLDGKLDLAVMAQPEAFRE